MKKQFTNTFKMSLKSWLIFIILGLFLIFKVELTLKIISYVVGGTLLLAIIPLTKQLLSHNPNYTNYAFISEVFMIVAGIIIILNTELIVSIIPILIGILMLINGIYKLQFAFILKNSNIKNWQFTLVLAIFIIAGGILFLTNPFKGAITITRLIGVFMIIYSIIDMLDFIIIHKEIKNFKDATPDINSNKNIKIIEGE